MSSIDKHVFTYISLDGVVMGLYCTHTVTVQIVRDYHLTGCVSSQGRGSFMASASPMLYSLIESTIKEVSNDTYCATASYQCCFSPSGLTFTVSFTQVRSPFDSGSLYNVMGKNKWEANV